MATAISCQKRCLPLLFIALLCFGVVVYFLSLWSFDLVFPKIPLHDIKEDMKITQETYEVNVVLDGGKENITLNYYPPMETYNDIRVSYFDNCTSVAAQSGKFVVVTNFIYFSLDKYKQNLFSGGATPLNDAMIEARVMEVVDVLDRNLGHPYIKEIHVLVQEREAIEYLRHLPIKNSRKMVIHVPKDSATMYTQLKYAGECLVNNIVAISHQDNAFRKGWEKLQPSILQNNKIAYAITRHIPEEVACNGAKYSANCSPGSSYLGSHDVFVFYVKEKFDKSQLKDIENVTPNLYGMENLLIWMFGNKLNYKVLNPCYILKVHHHHCIPIRDKGRRRVNGGGHSGGAGFTDQLQ